MQDLLEIVSVYHIDFFSLDVEGGELAVLQSIDFHKVFIGVIVIEADDHNPQKNQAVQDLLLGNGFDYFIHVGANDWFVNKKFKYCNNEKLQSSPSLDLMNLQKFAGRPNSKHVNCAKDIVSRKEAFAQISS